MVFVGFEDGSKAIRYWDKETRKIKVLRNMVFNENDKPEQYGEVPGVSAEVESGINPTSTQTEKGTDPQDVPTIPTSNIPQVETETRNLRPRTKIDYKQLSNPSIRQPPQKTQQPS